MDVEDRIRAVLQPSSSHQPYTFESSFYPAHANKGRAPDRLVTQQMKIFKEQWAGMGMSFDLGAVKGDMEMAGAVWRNFLGARGARGIAFASTPKTEDSATTSPLSFRRSINLVGGLVENLAEIDKKGLEAEEARDDYSGVHDYMPSEAEKYLSYPEVILDIVTYIRRELARLTRIGDEEILQGDVHALKFARVKTTPE
jgi:cytochrome b pre-mRNA-processing protein 3